MLEGSKFFVGIIKFYKINYKWIDINCYNLKKFKNFPVMKTQGPKILIIMKNFKDRRLIKYVKGI